MSIALGVLDSGVSRYSPVFGVSLFLELLGVPLLIVRRLCRPPDDGPAGDDPGITMSERAFGAPPSIELRLFPLVLLSLRRSRSDLSPRTTGLLLKPPAELADDTTDTVDSG